jgi:tRNA (guanine-N7-)-methyltransferase
MKERRKIEREFGVPIAGEILEPARWTQTALKRLPPEGPLNWEALFGRRTPIVLDLGCGNARFLIASAVWRPDHDHVGVDILPLVLRYATRRANQRGLSNIRFAAIDARSLLEKYVPPGSVSEIHLYHPQPYHDPRDQHRRLVTPEFLSLIHDCLVDGGLFFVQTDNVGYWEYLREVVPAFFDFHAQERPWPDAPKGRTRREIIALKRGLPVFRGWGRARELNNMEEQELVNTLPPPHFDAGLKPNGFDDMERSDA